MSERNPWLGEKKHSSFLDGSSSGWPDWDTNDSSKCRDRSGWSSWEIYQGNKGIHKDDAVGKGAPTVLDSWSDKKGIEQCNSEISERNPWLGTENHSSSLDNSSRGWSDWDTGDSPKCNKHSGWPSWESLQGNKDLHKDDAIGKGALTISDSCSGEQRGRGRVRKRSTERGRSRTPKRDKSSWETKRSRSRERDYGKSRNGSPFNGLTQASCVSTETGSDFGMTSRRCRDFAAGKCVRGSRCRFVHHGYLEKRERNHLENQVAERSKVTADHGGSLQHGDYKRSADSLRDISNGRGKYYEDDEGRKNTICCKQFLRGKCYRGTSCRYSHHKAAGKDYHKGNEGAVCDQNVKSLAKLGGRSDDDKWEQNFDVTKSWNGPRWDNDGGSLDTGKNRACSEDEKKSWNGPKWGDEASFPDAPKATGWGDSSARTTNSRDPATADYRTDESKVKGCPEWSEKLSDRSKKNGLKWDNGGGSVVTGKKRVCSEDEKNPWNGPTWGDEACFPDEPKAIGWGNSSVRTTNSHDPVIAVYRTDESKVKRCREWSEILSDRSKKNGPRWDNNASSLNTRKNRACTEDEKKPWNGPSWGDEASFPDDPKATGWGESSARTNNSHDPATADYRTDESKVKGCPEWNEKVSDRTKKESPLLDTAKAMEVWEDRNYPKIVADRPPSSGRGNSSFRNKISHVPVAANELNRGNHSNDPTCSDVALSLDGLQGTVWDGRSRGNMYSQDRSDVKKQIDNNLVCSSVKKSSQRADPGWSEKFPERDEWCSGGNGADNHHTKLTDLKMLVNRKKPGDQWEDKATLWSGPTWDDKDCSSDRPEATGWGGRSRGNTDTHVSVDTEKENVCEVVNSLVQKSNGSVASRWNEKVTERDEYMLSHWQNNYNGRVTRTSKPTDSIRLMDGEEATNEWEDGRKCLDKGTSKLVDSEKLYEVGDLGFPPSSSRSGTNESCHAPSGNHFNGLNNFLDRSVQHKVSVRNQMRIQLDKAVRIPENGERELINLESSPTPVTENGQQNPLDTTGEQCKQDHRSTHSASFEAQCNAGESFSNQDTVMTWSFKIALVELVKEILKPTWKKGKMSKEVHIAIVKKAVDKVISAETERDNIPKTREHIDYYLSVSKPCITNFVKSKYNEYEAS